MAHKLVELKSSTTIRCIPAAESKSERMSSDHPPSRSASAEYIAIEASRLARMATANEFPLLAYLIEMAVLEAWREANEPERGPPGTNGGAMRSSV
jgi:hypothetical protein